MQQTPALVRGEGEQRELDRRHVRRLVVKDGFGRRRVERGRVVAGKRERDGWCDRPRREREAVSTHGLPVPVGRTGQEVDRVTGLRLERDTDVHVLLARVNVVLQIRRREA